MTGDYERISKYSDRSGQPVEILVGRSAPSGIEEIIDKVLVRGESDQPLIEIPDNVFYDAEGKWEPKIQPEEVIDHIDYCTCEQYSAEEAYNQLHKVLVEAFYEDSGDFPDPEGIPDPTLDLDQTEIDL